MEAAFGFFKLYGDDGFVRATGEGPDLGHATLEMLFGHGVGAHDGVIAFLIISVVLYMLRRDKWKRPLRSAYLTLRTQLK